VADDLRQVDEVISRRLASDVPLVREVAQYIVASGGKRLRPAVLLLAAGAAGCRAEKTVLHDLAAVLEYIHTATLLHDDVVDESALRRGRNTANAAFGNAAAVLVGDFLYSRAFQMMVEVDDMRVMQVLAEATNTIAGGEVMQLMGSHDPEVDEARYLEVIRRKTAKLFEAAARLGGVLTRQSGLEEGLAEYGRRVGTAFQLIDDVLDYSGDEATIGKSLGDDLAEGKPTLPLIRVRRAGGFRRGAGGDPRLRRARLRARGGAAGSGCGKQRPGAASRLGIQAIFARIGVLFRDAQQLDSRHGLPPVGA
jgi:octaprenyl-diphosphate synthase